MVENRMNEPLSGPVFILDHPSHGGNVGAALRAITNMGFEHLRLVRPRFFPHPDVEAWAAGTAARIPTIQVFDSLDAATADLNHLVAVTRRGRGQRHQVMSPRELGVRLDPKQQLASSRVGILFGTERTGLETADVERCHWICTIPTHGEKGSLNLSQAVMLVAYELMLGQGLGEVPVHDPQRDDALASQDEMVRFFDHLQDVLMQIDFIQPDRYKQMMGTLKALFNRAALDRREITILRGILTEVIHHCARKISALQR
ncbi:tRNA/rRNA methyltransferase (SpoU) [Magnetococcus marinus MC-1]|uniref:tRNA/rRNA methyltransferase (SpoU) n=2 Tax=Magnetococcus TaxID=162171 RepID=A0L7Y7_MAGMM|nr:tRNA/rRNA methyltransferase (SpoU) [Magnetococcus marinus MC-1]